jgi:hypothetical protein
VASFAALGLLLVCAGCAWRYLRFRRGDSRRDRMVRSPANTAFLINLAYVQPPVIAGLGFCSLMIFSFEIGAPPWVDLIVEALFFGYLGWAGLRAEIEPSAHPRLQGDQTCRRLLLPRSSLRNLTVARPKSRNVTLTGPLPGEDPVGDVA